MSTTDGSSAVEQKVGFDQLSENDVVSSLFETEEKQEEKIEEKKEEKKEELEIKVPGDEEKKEEKKEEKSEEKSEEKKEEKKEEEDLADEIKLPGEEEKQEEKKEGAVAEDSWLPVAKELGYELKTDSFDAFKEIIIAEKAKIIADAKKEAESIAKDDIIKKYPVEAQVLIQGLETGLTIDQLQKPFETIDELLRLSDEDLVSKDRELQEMPADLIEKEILSLSDKDQLQLEAFRLRKLLKDGRENAKASQLEQIKALAEKRKNETIAAKAKDADEIEKELKATTQFMGAAIKEKHIKFLMDKWRKGEYQDVFKDSKTVSKMLLYLEFGETATGLLAQRKFEEGKSGIVDKLHVIPPKPKGSGSSIVKQEEGEKKGFGILEGVTADDL